MNEHILSEYNFPNIEKVNLWKPIAKYICAKKKCKIHFLTLSICFSQISPCSLYALLFKGLHD